MVVDVPRVGSLVVEHYTTVTIYGKPVCVRGRERERERERDREIVCVGVHK